MWNRPRYYFLAETIRRRYRYGPRIYEVSNDPYDLSIPPFNYVGNTTEAAVNYVLEHLDLLRTRRDREEAEKLLGGLRSGVRGWERIDRRREHEAEKQQRKAFPPHLYRPLSPLPTS